jgi:DNA repair photolyase
MKRVTGHSEAWGEFVDVKINAPHLLEREIKRKRVGRVWISGVCDPYQPLERKYELTKKCLDILLRHDWPVTIQTKSPLILRDMNLLTKSKNIEVGFTIATADEKVRRIIEPKAPPIFDRINALKKLHSVGIKTFTMIAPLLPGAEGLAEQLSGKVDYVLIDKMNYHYADQIYKKHGFEYAVSNDFFIQQKSALTRVFEKKGIPYQILF